MLKITGKILVLLVIPFYLAYLKQVSHPDWPRETINFTIPGDLKAAKVQSFSFPPINKLPRNLQPFILEIAINNLDAARSLTVSLNNQAAGSLEFPPGISKRKLELPKDALQSGNQLQLRADSEAWQILQLRIKNVYAFSRGNFGFNITHRDLHSQKPQGIEAFTSWQRFFLLLCLYLLILSLWIPRGATADRKDKNSRLTRALFLTYLAILTVPLVLPLVSKFVVIFSPFLFCCWMIPSIIFTCVFRQINFKNRLIWIPLFVFLFYFVLALHQVNRAQFKQNFSGLLRLRDKRIEAATRQKVPLPLDQLVVQPIGHDAQFYYYVALDPWIQKIRPVRKYRKMLDRPVYRYSRIGYPWLINLFSGGNRIIFPETMIILILFSHLLAAYFLCHICIHYHAPPRMALLYLLIPGYVWSLSLGLAESIAGMFLICGFYFLIKEKTWFYVPCFAFSILVRETGILFVLAVIVHQFVKNKNWRQPLLTGISLIPFLLWRVYLTWQFFPDYGWNSLLIASKTMGFFLKAAGISIQQLMTGTYPTPQQIFTAWLYPVILITIFVWALWKSLTERAWIYWVISIYSFFSLSLSCQVWKSAGNIVRVSFDVILFFILAAVIDHEEISLLHKIIFSLCLIIVIFTSPHSPLAIMGFIHEI